MTRRMIDASLWQNEKFTGMPLGARMLQIGIITHADDQGRVKANPSFLRNQIFPDDEDITNADIAKWLGLMVKNGTILLYTVDEKQYAQLANWWKYQALQYAQPSHFPRPEGWQDRIRKTVTKGFIATCNWITVDGTPLQDTCDQDGNPLPRKAIAPLPAPSTPSANGHSPAIEPVNQVEFTQPSASYSPESTPDYSPERTNKLNINELNITTTTRAREVEPEPESKSGGGGLPENRNRQTDQEYAQICSKFEKEGFGTLTQIMGEEINALMNEHPATSILDAMSIAVTANNRQLRYVRGILNRWRASGRNGPKQPPKQPTTPAPLVAPDWMTYGIAEENQWKVH